jgi:hypothetical protein
MPHLSNVLRLKSLQNNLREHTEAEKTGATKLTDFIPFQQEKMLFCFNLKFQLSWG